MSTITILGILGNVAQAAADTSGNGVVSDINQALAGLTSLSPLIGLNPVVSIAANATAATNTVIKN